MKLKTCAAYSGASVRVIDRTHVIIWISNFMQGISILVHLDHANNESFYSRCWIKYDNPIQTNHDGIRTAWNSELKPWVVQICTILTITMILPIVESIRQLEYVKNITHYSAPFGRGFYNFTNMIVWSKIGSQYRASADQLSLSQIGH